MTKFVSARTAFCTACALYVLAPGHPDAFFHGVPIGLLPLAAVVLCVFVCAYLRAEPGVARNWRRGAVALTVLIAGKIAIASLVPTPGWKGSYFAATDFSGPVRHSTDFPRLDATRIDRRIAFRDDFFPVYFLNEADFNRGIRREVSEPVTVQWIGHVAPDRPTSVRLTLAARGRAWLAIDGAPTLEASTGSTPAEQTVLFPPGDRELVLRYVKTQNTDPLIELHGLDDGSTPTSMLVTPQPVPPWRRAIYRPALVVAWTLDALAVLMFVVVMAPVAVGRMRATGPVLQRLRDPAPLSIVMFLLIAAQGLRASMPLVGRAVSLSGGDDWLAYEARARAVALGDLLIRYGQPFLHGDAFYYYPGYSYFLAAVHAIAGEDLAAPIFMQFLLLFLTNVIVFRMAAKLFDRQTALLGVALLLAVEEVAFMRFYTQILLGENLYVFTVAATVAGLVAFSVDGRRSDLIWSGLAAGCSALIRPVFMLYLAPALAIVIIAARQRRVPWPAVATTMLLFAGCWIGVDLLATVRNLVVSGHPIFIVVSPAHTFVLYNLPSVDQDVYRRAFTGGIPSAARVLWRISIEHPADMLRNVSTKVAFCFGLLNLMGARLHPELLLASVGYVAAVVFLPIARALRTWPVHAFVLAHVAGLVIAIPSIYGYRLILPMYVFLPVFASAAGMMVLARLRRGRSDAIGAPMAVTGLR
jgi:hypothetical protein